MANAPRKVPVHRGSPGAGGAARAASHPGLTGSGQAASNFQSPFQPPSSKIDFSADVAALDPNAWHVVMVADTAWRVKVPSPSALELLADMASASGARRVKVLNGYLAAHLHPDDLVTMVMRMADPDDTFTSDDYISLYRAAVTVGTARPF